MMPSERVSCVVCIPMEAVEAIDIFQGIPALARAFLRARGYSNVFCVSGTYSGKLRRYFMGEIA